MTQEEAWDIILNDNDYLNMTQWTKKHWKAQELYCKYCGMKFFARKRYIRRLKKEVKKYKNGKFS